MRRPELWLAAALALLTPGLAHAQAMQCRVPGQLPEARSVVIPRGEVPSRQPATTGYTLALSWSPEYCRTREGDADAAMQCDGKIGEFGFILHGLWPEGERGDPRWCRAVPPVDRATTRATLCAMPSVELMAHEWAKHGSCVTKTPASYFAAARGLFDVLSFPDMDRLSRANGGSGSSAGDIRAALVTENDGLTAEMIGIDTNARGWLEEVRICLDTGLRPAACPRNARGVGERKLVRIWRGNR